MSLFLNLLRIGVYAILNNSQEATYASGRSTSNTKTWVKDPDNP